MPNIVPTCVDKGVSSRKLVLVGKRLAAVMGEKNHEADTGEGFVDWPHGVPIL
jgi:hypothetical protein